MCSFQASPVTYWCFKQTQPICVFSPTDRSDYKPFIINMCSFPLLSGSSVTHDHRVNMCGDHSFQYIVQTFGMSFSTTSDWQQTFNLFKGGTSRPTYFNIWKLHIFSSKRNHVGTRNFEHKGKICYSLILLSEWWNLIENQLWCSSRAYCRLELFLHIVNCHVNCVTGYLNLLWDNKDNFIFGS